MRTIKTFILAGVVALAASSSFAAGVFEGYPAVTPPLTGVECIPADAFGPSAPANTQGVNPATVCMTPGNITSIGQSNALGYHSNIPIGGVAYGSLGTNTTDVAGQLWVSSFQMPLDRTTITGLNCLQGATATTDKIIGALYKQNLTGDTTMATLVASSALAGISLATGDTFKQLPFTAAVTGVKAGKYFMVVQGNGTAAGAIRTIAANTYIGLTAGSIAGSFGTLTSTITFPTTFTADKAPICYVY